METERKYLITSLPEGYEDYPSRDIEQAYLCTDPVVRVRREDDIFYLTYKSGGFLTREEYNLPLNREAYDHLVKKADGVILTKRRYRIPLEGTSLIIELDIFSAVYEGLMLAEIEFPSVDEALAFNPPEWFGEDVTMSGRYQNSRLSMASENP